MRVVTAGHAAIAAILNSGTGMMILITGAQIMAVLAMGVITLKAEEEV